MSFLRLYDEGKYLPITSHRPPEPFGKETYKHEKTPGVADLSRETLGQLSYDDLVYARHPRERHEPSLYPLPDWFSDDETAALEIVARKSFSHSGGAQVVLCEVKSPAATLWEKMGHKVPDLVIAKIFDPAFYLYPDKVAAADREYAQEAAAYMQLHDKRTEPSYANKTGMIPRFFGTWTMDITAKHLGNSFMNTADRKATLVQGAKARAPFDTAASEASTELKPQEFRPVRMILVEYIEGLPLEQFLIKTPDYEGHLIIEPTPEFESEEKRLPIFASIMDTVARIEHLGVSLHEIRISPSNFILKTRTDDTKTQYDIVMIDFMLADVTKYTRIGFNIDEKLPRPMHPLTSRRCDHWYLFCGWIPEKWSAVYEDGVRSYETWGESQFRITDYSTPDVVEDIARPLESNENLQGHGMIPPEEDDDDPEWDEKLQQHANNPHRETMTYDNVHGFESFDYYEKHREEIGKKILAKRARDEEKEDEIIAALVERIKRQQAQLKAKREAEEGQVEGQLPTVRAVSDIPAHCSSDAKPAKARDSLRREAGEGHVKQPSRHFRAFETDNNNDADDNNERSGQETLQKAFSNDPGLATRTYDNEKIFRSKKEYDQYCEDMARDLQAKRTARKEEECQQQEQLSRDIEEDEERIPQREAKRKAKQKAKQPANLRKSTADTNCPKLDMSVDAKEHGLAREDDDKNCEEARKREEEAKERVFSIFDSIVAEQWALVEMRHEAFLLKNSPYGIYLPGRKEGKWDWEKRSWEQRIWDVSSNGKFWTLEEGDKYHDGVYEALRNARDKSEGLDRQMLDERLRMSEKARAKEKERRQRDAIECRFPGMFNTPEGDFKTKAE